MQTHQDTAIELESDDIDMQYPTVAKEVNMTLEEAGDPTPMNEREAKKTGTKVAKTKKFATVAETTEHKMTFWQILSKNIGTKKVVLCKQISCKNPGLTPDPAGEVAKAIAEEINRLHTVDEPLEIIKKSTTTTREATFTTMPK